MVLLDPPACKLDSTRIPARTRRVNQIRLRRVIVHHHHEGMEEQGNQAVTEEMYLALVLEKISSLIQKRCASIKHRAYQHRFSKPMTDECASSVDLGLVNLCGVFLRVFRCASQTIHARNVCTYIRTGIPQCQR